MNRPPNTTKAQAGVMLLEALIAILIFSLGILSLVALQGTSIQLTSDAKYRTDATLLANRLIGQMWASDLTPPTCTQFSTAIPMAAPTTPGSPMCRGSMACRASSRRRAASTRPCRW
ncbi:MAG: type IV pilus modification protein PilV [Candidatus Accumulibacter sp.]|nr:type IV pilus modification protein PilV [Candidatus Accumulibacter propinquus]